MAMTIFGNAPKHAYWFGNEINKIFDHGNLVWQRQKMLFGDGENRIREVNAADQNGTVTVSGLDAGNKIVITYNGIYDSEYGTSYLNPFRIGFVTSEMVDLTEYDKMTVITDASLADCRLSANQSPAGANSIGVYNWGWRPGSGALSPFQGVVNGGTAVFDMAAFRAAYPEYFGSVSDWYLGIQIAVNNPSYAGITFGVTQIALS